MRLELESIYRTAPVGLAVLDTDLRFLHVNERLAEMNGVSVQAHIGRTVGELLPDIAEQAEGMLRRVLHTGESIHDLEVRGQTPAQPGVERVWMEQISPLRDEHGRITRLSVVAEEITERRRAEESLRRSEETLALAMEAAGLALCEWDIVHDEVRYGAHWEQVLGYRPPAGTIAQWSELLHPGDRDRAQACMAAHLAGRLAVYDCEYRMRHADGHWVWVAHRGRVVERDDEGRPQRMIGVARDTTEAKQSEARLLERERELRHSQERLQVALDAGHMGVWDWTPGAESGFWSDEVYKLLGLSLPQEEPAQMLRFMQMVHPDDRASLDAEIARVLAKGGDYEAEFRIVRADGALRWLVSRGRVLHGGDGHRSRMVGVNFDITERKLIEQAMRDADARRTEFLAMLAHELRNPLAPIANAVRLLERVGDIPQRREVATQILRRQTAHMARLVDDLLEVSRITQGRIELRMENVLIATCVFQAVEAARPQARERRQEIAVDVPPTLDLVADPARLTQIIANLVTNAVKYTPEGGRIEVSAEPEAPDHLFIAVQDNGPGISPELQPKLFDLFAQDKRTLDRAQGGLGIGLALVKQLTELHGGHVRYDSRGPHSGARFVVCLPRHGRREELRGSPVTACAACIPPLPFLVVDDNRDAAETLASLLRLDGHRVETAFDGEQALAAARERPPKVLLLDLGLPKVDGLQVARSLRADARFDDTVLIAMSGYAQASDRDAAHAAGFDSHLAKPVELAQIYREVESLLRRSANERPSAM